MELPGIVASPRKMGNCELIVKALGEKVPARLQFPVPLRYFRGGSGIPYPTDLHGR